MKFRHLEEKKIGYMKHMCRAFYYSLLSLKAGIIFCVHAIYPDVWENTGSDTIIGLHELFEENNMKKQ